MAANPLSTQMAEALALVPTILSLLNKIPEAVHGASELKQTMRQRCSEYESMLAYLSSKPDLVDANGLEHELDRLRDLFTQVPIWLVAFNRNVLSRSGCSRLMMG